MPLYYVPVLLVIDAERESSAEEISDRILDGVAEISPVGLEGLVIVDNLEKAIPASYGWMDMEHHLIVSAGDKKFTIKEKEEE